MKFNLIKDMLIAFHIARQNAAFEILFRVQNADDVRNEAQQTRKSRPQRGIDDDVKRIDSEWACKLCGFDIVTDTN